MNDGENITIDDLLKKIGSLVLQVDILREKIEKQKTQIEELSASKEK